MKKILFFSLSAVTVVFRFFQLLFGIDPQTGFSVSPIWEAMLYVLLAAAALYLAVSVCCNRSDDAPAPRKNSRLSTVTVLIFAVAAEFFCVSEYLRISSLSETLNNNYRIQRTITLICVIVGALAGLLLVFDSVRDLSSSGRIAPNLFTSLATSLFSVMILFVYYTSHDTMVTISQNLLGLFFWMSTAFFCYGYTRYLSDSKTFSSYRISLVFGLTSTLVGAVLVVPYVIFSLIRGFVLTGFDTFSSIMIIPATVVIAVSVFSLYFRKENVHENDSQVD